LTERPASAELAKVASVNFICPPREARRRIGRVEKLGFEEILIGSQFGTSRRSSECAISSTHSRAPHCQLNGPRAPFGGLARLERGSRIGEKRTFRPEPPRHRHN